MRARRPSPLTVLTLAALLIAGAWGVLLAARHLDGRASALDRIEAALVDLRFQVTGPRPAPARELVQRLKAEGMPHDDFIRELHTWYAHDRTQATQNELLALVQGLEQPA